MGLRFPPPPCRMDPVALAQSEQAWKKLVYVCTPLQVIFGLYVVGTCWTVILVPVAGLVFITVPTSAAFAISAYGGLSLHITQQGEWLPIPPGGITRACCCCSTLFSQLTNLIIWSLLPPPYYSGFGVGGWELNCTRVCSFILCALHPEMTPSFTHQQRYCATLVLSCIGSLSAALIGPFFTCAKTNYNSYDGYSDNYLDDDTYGDDWNDGYNDGYYFPQVFCSGTIQHGIACGFLAITTGLILLTKTKAKTKDKAEKTKTKGKRQ